MPESYFQEYCLTLFKDIGFYTENGISRLIPNDYNSLKEDKLYKTLINTRIAQTRVALKDLEFNHELVEKLIKSISKEIQ